MIIGELVIGLLIIDEDKYYIFLSINEHIKRDDYEVYMVEINKDTIGQYTGLKDKNGKEIYEGDIVEMHYFFGDYDVESLGFFENETKITGLVKINEYGTYVETKSGEDYYIIQYLESPTDQLEIIGNIYDNPELLEEE